MKLSGGVLLSSAAAGSAGSLLAACGSDSGSGSGDAREISFWNFHGPDDQDSPRSQWIVELVEEWNRNNDVTVKLHYVPAADYVAGNALQVAFQSGPGPDIFLISAGDILRYANNDVLADLAPYVSDEAHADFNEAAMATRMDGDKVLALPSEISPLIMYYSVDAFESAGLSEADVPSTWEDMLDVAEQLTTADRFGVLFHPDPGYYQNFTWYPLLWAGGGDVVSQDGRSSTFDSEAAVAALGFWQDTVKRGVAPTSANGRGGSDIMANLVAGTCAMQNTTVALVENLRNEAPDFRFGIAGYPLPPGGEAVTCLGGWSYAANARGGNPEAAAEFIAWALADTSAEGIDRMRQWQTGVSTYMPVRRSVVDAAADEGYFEDAVLKQIVEDIVPTGRAEPRFPPEVYQPVSDAIQATQINGEDPEAAAATAHEAINDFLETYDGARIR